MAKVACPDIKFIESRCPIEWNNHQSFENARLQDFYRQSAKHLDDICIGWIEEYLGRKIDLVKDSPRIQRVTFPDTPTGDFYLCIDGKSLGYLTTTYRFSDYPDEMQMKAEIKLIKAKPLP